MTGSRRSRLGLSAVVLVLGAFLVVSTGLPAFAGRTGATGATVYVLQGLPGVTADVEVDGSGVATGVTRASIVGPLQLTAGRHVVAFSTGGTPLVSASIDVVGGASLDVVGYWAAQTPRTARLVALANDIAPIDRGRARLEVTHAMAAPPADIAVNGKVLLHAVANGESLSVVVPAGTSTVTATATIGGQALLPPASLRAAQGTFTRAVLIGAPNMRSDVLVHVVRVPVTGAGRPSAVHTGNGGQASGLVGIPIDPLAVLTGLPRWPFLLFAAVFALLAVAVAVPVRAPEPYGDLIVVVPRERRSPPPRIWFLVVLLLASAGVCGAGARLAGGGPDADGPAAAHGPTSASRSGGTEVALLRPARVVPAARSVDAAAAPLPAPAAPVGPAYRVGASPFRPERLLLPGGASAPVAAVGLRRDGSLVVPDDPRVVGWWTGGAMPGEPFGSVVVAGHVDSASRGVGVLAALPGLRAGQLVELRAGVRDQRYRIVSARFVPQDQLSRTGGVFSTGGAPQLVLITCGGAFDPVRHHYADNYVVVARPVSDG